VAKQMKLTAASGYSSRDAHEAKKEWSQRFLMGPVIATAASAGLTRRAGAHAVAVRAAAPKRDTNVVGVGVAEKIVDGRPTGVLAVKFYVKTKYPKGAVRAVLPKTIDGVPTDVEQAGTFHAFKRTRRTRSAAPLPNPRTRMRPALPGCSVGFRIAGDQFVMGGTFGALVKTSSRVYILSNNHVLADENRLPIGSPIFQPGLLDRGRIDSDQIAELTRFVKLKANRFNKIDAAIARPLNRNLIGREVLHIGAPTAPVAAAIDMMVHKFGRTTSYTVGRVTSVDTDVIVEYETGLFTFDNQIIIQGTGGQMFSDSGDSGSIILQRGTNAAVGLLFGGGPDHTIANHIADVLRSLRVRL
jgi:S1-C subfamily serine protease